MPNKGVAGHALNEYHDTMLIAFSHDRINIPISTRFMFFDTFMTLKDMSFIGY
ncbi:hypothetical protein SX4_2188 [Vibrio mimicus SX-4]|nr:hypothetical protein SX4_2188 [Vibrio mimicus SX-4]